MKFSEMKTDSTKEQEGVWIHYGRDVKLKICRLSNPKARQYADELRRPHAKELKRVSDLRNPILRELMRKVVARHVLVDWENIQDDSGQDVPYTEQNALKFFAESEDFFDDVVELANDRDLFRAECIEADLGN